MRRILLFVSLLVIAGCAKGPQADLQYIGEARSAAAEWALVNQQAAAGKLSQAYVSSMHQWLRDDLQTSLSSLTERNSRYGEEIQALLEQPDDAAPQQLRAHAEKLKQIEDSLESA
jgi:Tfp pilus assembly protein PilP